MARLTLTIDLDKCGGSLSEQLEEAASHMESLAGEVREHAGAGSDFFKNLGKDTIWSHERTCEVGTYEIVP